MSGAFHRCFRLLDGVHDVRVGGAAAKGAAHTLADVGVGSSVSLIHAGHGRDDLPRGTIAALKRIVIDKGLLHWVRRSVLLRQTFNSDDVATLDSGNQRQT